MTTPKRWYQLSMLQLLVAMAVMALIVWMNVVPKKVHSSTWRELGMSQFTMGWPFVYSECFDLNDADRKTFPSTFSVQNVWAFALNIPTALAILIASVYLAGLCDWIRKCPSRPAVRQVAAHDNT